MPDLLQDSPDILDVLRQRKLQEMMSQAQSAPIAGQEPRGPELFVRPPNIMGPLNQPRPEEQAPTPPPVQPRVQPIQQAQPQPQPEIPKIPPTMISDEATPPQNLPAAYRPDIQTVPKPLQPVAPFGRDLATPPAQFQTPPEVAAAQANLNKAAQVQEGPVSKMRKLGAVLAGIGGGFLGGPFMGMDLYGRVAHGAYNAKVGSILRNQALLERAAKLAEGTQKQTMEGAKTEAESAKDYEEGRYKRAETDRLQQTPIQQPKYEPHTEEEYKRQKEIDAAAAVEAFKPSSDGKLYTVNTSDGGVLNGVTRLQTKPGVYELRDAKGALIKPQLVADISEQTKEREEGANAYQSWYQAYKKEHNGQAPGTKEVQAYNDSQRAAPDPSLRAMHALAYMKAVEEQNEKVGNAASAARGIALNTRAGTKNLTGKEKMAAERAFMQGTHGMLSPPIANTEADRRDDAAGISMEHVNNLEQLFKDNPWLKDKIGIATGRINEAEFKLGRFFTGGLTDKQKQVLSQVFTQLKGLTIQDTAALTGGRPHAKILGLVQDSTPKPGDSFENIKGKLDGVRRMAQIVHNETAKMRMGANATFVGPDGQEQERLQIKDNKPVMWIDPTPEEKKAGKRGRFVEVQFPGE